MRPAFHWGILTGMATRKTAPRKTAPAPSKPVKQAPARKPAIASKDPLKAARQRIAELERQLADARDLPEPGRLRCPRCQGRMDEYQHDVVKADRCQSCGGIFFDKGELEAVIAAHDRAQATPGLGDRNLIGLMKAMLGK